MYLVPWLFQAWKWALKILWSFYAFHDHGKPINKTPCQLKRKKKKFQSSYHTTSVSLHELHNAGWVFVPQVDVSTVTATDHKLTAGAVEIHSLHWNTRPAENPSALSSSRIHSHNQITSPLCSTILNLITDHTDCNGEIQTGLFTGRSGACLYCLDTYLWRYCGGLCISYCNQHRHCGLRRKGKCLHHCS